MRNLFLFLSAGLLLFSCAKGAEQNSQIEKAESAGAVFLSKDGKDPRVPMLGSRNPWSAIGRVELHHGNVVHSCTGTLVGRRLMVTAAHCVLIDHQIQTVIFKANYINGKSPAISTSRFITVGTRDPDTHFEEDWAIVELNDLLGDKQGYMGIASPTGRPLPIKLTYAGYSSDFSKSQVAGVDPVCFIRTIYSNTRIGHDCSAESGGSGGPLFSTAQSLTGQIFAIHTRGFHDRVYRTWTNEVTNVAVSTNRFYPKLSEMLKTRDK